MLHRRQGISSNKSYYVAVSCFNEYGITCPPSSDSIILAQTHVIIELIRYSIWQAYYFSIKHLNFIRISSANCKEILKWIRNQQKIIYYPSKVKWLLHYKKLPRRRIKTRDWKYSLQQMRTMENYLQSFCFLCTINTGLQHFKQEFNIIYYWFLHAVHWRKG